ncbi:MAG: hypothetical protein AB7G88_06065 [Thermomicrobiales bacterium]
MRLTYGRLPDRDDALEDRQKAVAASLLNASQRLAEMGRQQLRLDLADIAVRVLENDSYAYWPRKAGQ